MRTFIRFDHPDDDVALRLAQNGPTYWAALWELREGLRALAKHGDFRCVADYRVALDDLFLGATKDINWEEIP